MAILSLSSSVFQLSLKSILQQLSLFVYCALSRCESHQPRLHNALANYSVGNEFHQNESAKARTLFALLLLNYIPQCLNRMALEFSCRDGFSLSLEVTCLFSVKLIFFFIFFYFIDLTLLNIGYISWIRPIKTDSEV